MRYNRINRRRTNRRVEQSPYGRFKGDQNQPLAYDDRIERSGPHHRNPTMSRRERLGISPHRNHGPIPRIRGGRGQRPGKTYSRPNRGRSCCGG